MEHRLPPVLPLVAVRVVSRVLAALDLQLDMGTAMVASMFVKSHQHAAGARNG